MANPFFCLVSANRISNNSSNSGAMMGRGTPLNIIPGSGIMVSSLYFHFVQNSRYSTNMSYLERVMKA